MDRDGGVPLFSTVDQVTNATPENAMLRIRWSLVAIALLSLPLVSCFSDVGDCPTCPPVASARIGIFLPGTFDLDSVYVGLGGPPRFRLRRGQSGSFNELQAGTYTVNAILFRTDVNGILESKPVSVSVELQRGETRTVVFHHDLPVVVWAPEAAPDGAPDAGVQRLAARPIARARAG
jgi:hypothetical protein